MKTTRHPLAAICVAICAALGPTAARAQPPGDLIDLVGARASHSGDFEDRFQRAEAFARRNPNFEANHTMLLAAVSLCGAGSGYYVASGRYPEHQLDMIRQLLRFRFNGTAIDDRGAGQIHLEDSAGSRVNDADALALVADPAALRSMGRPIAQAVRELSFARTGLAAVGASRFKEPSEISRRAEFIRYDKAARRLTALLGERFKIIAIDNLVDCD